MANIVRIASIAPRQLVDPSAGTDQAAVDRFIGIWKDRFDQVLPDRPDLIVVPEACDRYHNHTMEQRKAYYAQRGTQVRDLFASVAAQNNCCITYSAVWPMADGTWRNRIQLLGRDGKLVGHYDKNHLVFTETTESGILCGTEAPLLQCDFGRVGFMICFDLNFERLRNHYAKLRPDLLVFSSNYHGGLALYFWAYACRAHIATALAGLPSGVVSPQGEQLGGTTNYTDFVVQDVNLDCKLVHLDFHETKLPALKARYGKGVTIYDPGLLGSVLVTNNTKDRTINELLQEFEIEPLDDYLTRSLAHADNPANQARDALRREMLQR